MTTATEVRLRLKPPNADRARIARQVATLLLALQNRRYLPPVGDLAREMGVSKRTVFRYLDAVEQAGWPLPRRVSEVA